MIGLIPRSFSITILVKIEVGLLPSLLLVRIAAERFRSRSIISKEI
ncbi:MULTISPECIES: hypothetical protein [Mesotoga]|nr:MULTISPECIES: hypothetical protein [Mesotoga]